MKVVVTNFSGNVGKSMIANQLLAPRLGDATVIAVESINEDEANNETVRGTQFRALQRHLAKLPNAVVDVGASNVESFMQQLSEFEGAQEDFDYFVVPCTPMRKQLRDTISTIEALHGAGVEPERIVVVFNMVSHDAPVEDQFGLIFDAHRSIGMFTLAPEATIYES